MIKQAIVYTDQDGKEHICQKVGRLITVPVNQKGTIEEKLIFALRDISCDSSVKLGVPIKRCPKDASTLEVYSIHTGMYCYFVRVVDSNTFGIQLNKSPVGFGDENKKIYAIQEGNITVFFYSDISSGERISPYFYLQW